MELVAVAVVVGLGVLVLWPVARAFERKRSPRDQPPLTDIDEVPPLMPEDPLLPEDPVVSSRRHRRSHGKP